MEQLQAAEYWMWMKRKHVMKTTRNIHQQASSSMVMVMPKKAYESTTWEEEAFAEDAAGPLGLGGCIWPPRSYSCSFCRREFRSAQALGGHMNVHRRDRARLKQQSSLSPHPQNNEVDHHHHHKINNNNLKSSCTSTTTQSCPSDDQLICGTAAILDYNNHHYSNCSPNKKLLIASSSSSLSTSRVFLEKNFSEEQQTLDLSPYSKKSSPYVCTPPPPPPLFGSKSEEKYTTEENEEKMSLGMGRHGDDSCVVVVDTDLSVGLNNNCLVVERGDDQVISCKRHKSTFGNTDDPFFLKPCCLIINPSSSSMEELDLELRLGDPPKVK